MLIPAKKKLGQLIVVAICFVVAIVMLFVPSSFICSINIPFVNMNADQIILLFLETSDQYLVVNGIVSEFGLTIVEMVRNVIKSCVIFAIEGVILLIASLVTLIIYLVRKKEGKKKVSKAIFTTLGCLVMSFAFFLVPVYTISNIYVNMFDALGTDTAEEVLYSKYPEFRKYSSVIDLIDQMASLTDTDTILGEIPLWAADTFSQGDASQLSKDLASVDLIMYHFEEAGIPKIYDESFSFRDTTAETFNFSEMESVVGMTLESPIFAPIALVFVNDIMSCLEQQMEQDLDKEVDLQFTIDEFRTQYKEVLELLNVVIEYNLLNKLAAIMGNLNDFDAIYAEIEPIAREILANNTYKNKMLAIFDYEIIKNIGAYMDFDIGDSFIGNQIEELVKPAIAALYAGVKLYEVMDTWKSSYDNSSLYQASKRFLEVREVL